MQKRYTLIGLVSVVLLISYYLHVTKNEAEAPVIAVSDQTMVEYYDENNSVVTIVEKSANEFTLSGLGYEPTNFTLKEGSQDGEYTNSGSSLTVWKNGTIVSVYDGAELIFVGDSVIEEASSQPEETTPQADNPELLNYKWLWVKTELASGEVEVPRKPEMFSVTFSEDGRVNGTTDCNSFFGEYKLTDGEILFTPFGSTKMYCEDSQESVFMSALSQADQVVFDEFDNLTLNLKDGAGKIFFKIELIAM